MATHAIVLLQPNSRSTHSHGPRTTDSQTSHRKRTPPTPVTYRLGGRHTCRKMWGVFPIFGLVSIVPQIVPLVGRVRLFERLLASLRVNVRSNVLTRYVGVYRMSVVLKI